MLVLTRKVGEQLLIGEDVVITVLEVRGDGIKIGIDAPRDVKVQRREVLLSVSETNLESARAASPEAETALKALFGVTDQSDSAQARDPEPGGPQDSAETDGPDGAH
ncbi:carbon storage regulator CsrA [Nesterenkonia halotolerans]|uniref:carbon storage regulator CsrA n=1 Tax=Nesterenkonia halotolerans TaxID=225325 RepID=UPI003EE4F8BD